MGAAEVGRISLDHRAPVGLPSAVEDLADLLRGGALSSGNEILGFGALWAPSTVFGISDKEATDVLSIVAMLGDSAGRLPIGRISRCSLPFALYLISTVDFVRSR